MICDFGDVAVVPFPFVDMTISKFRPAVVLSNQTFNDENGNTMLAMITTAKRSAWPSDILLKDAEGAGLRQASYVRWKIFTLPNDLIHRATGSLGDKDKRTVRTALRKILP